MKTLTALVAALLLFSCQRRPLEDASLLDSARIRVEIDWSRSGIAVPAPNEAERVHRVSTRFFPEDGSPAFDCYLEGSKVTGGWIDVPIGKYAVVIFNESVHDAIYWSDAIRFTGTERYDDFAAHAVTCDDPALWAEEFPFYTAQPGESVVIGPDEPRRLASWSLPHFEVTTNMVRSSKPLTPYEKEMLEALTRVEMHPLTWRVNVTARVTNLVSAQANYCALSGLANTVYMATGERAHTLPPSVHLFKLNGRKWDPDGRSGTTSYSFLSFGWSTQQTDVCTLAVDALYVTGDLYTVDPPFNVTSQVQLGPNPDIDIHIDYDLEYRQGGIAVGDWKNDYHYEIK